MDGPKDPLRRRIPAARLLVASVVGLVALMGLPDAASALSAPVMATQPSSISNVPQGASVGFSASVNNDPASTAQWQKNISGTWTNVSGSVVTSTNGLVTSSTYTFTASSSTAGTYRVVFTNSQGSATSNSASLSVQQPNSAPQVTTQPTDQTVYLGNSATFTAAASGFPTPTVQWWSGTTINGVTTWSPIGGATSTTYSFITAKGSAGTKFRAVFTNSLGSVTTNEVTLLVHWAPDVAWVTPAAGADLICPIATIDATCLAYFGTSVSASPSATISWDRSSDEGATWTPVPGDVPANTYNILQTTVGKARDNDLYRMTATNTYSSVTLTKRLRVGVPPTVTKDPIRVQGAIGSTATFVADASSPDGYTQQWSHGTSSLAMVDIPGATGKTLTHTVHDATETVKVSFTNAYGEAHTSAILSVLPAVNPPGNAPYILTAPPTTATVDVGQPGVTLSATAGGDPSTVQWYQVINSTTTAIPGATSLSYTYNATSTANTSISVYPEFTNAYGTTRAPSTVITIRYAPYATTGDSTKLVSLTSSGSQVSTTINGSVTGNPAATFVWERSTDGGATWTTVAGAVGSTYTSAIGLSQNGYKYRVTGTNVLGSVVGPVTTLNVGVRPTITSISGAVTTPANTTASFTAVVSSLTSYSLIWERSTTSGGTYTAIPACADLLTCSFTAVPADNASFFRMRLINDYGSATSTSRSLTVTSASPPPPASVSATPGEHQATVSWSVPTNDGGSALTGYVITPIRNGVSQTPTTVAASTTSTTLTGLDMDVPYTFTVSAVNALGTGPASSPSAAVTPTGNHAPVAGDQAVDAPRRVVTSITLSALDPDVDPLAYSVTVQPTKGSLTCDSAGTCSYRSSPGATGTDSFEFAVDDGRGGSDTATISITLTNSPPLAGASWVDAPRLQPALIQLSASDPNGDLLTYQVTTEPTKGTVVCDADQCTYTSGPGQTGTDSLEYTVDDGHGGTDTETVSIALTNTTPTATPASYNVTKNIPKSFLLTGSDANGDSLTYALNTNPTNGTVSCVSNVCTYTASITSGGDSLSFTASDAFGGTSAPVTISLGIAPPKVSVGDAQALEPDSGSDWFGVMVPITLSAPLPTDVTITYYTENGTATGGASSGDYRIWGTPTAPKSIKIPAGQTWNAIAPPIMPDNTSEPDETFKVKILAVTAADGTNVGIGDATATVTIIDNYRAGGDPLMVVQDAWIYEGDTSTGSRAQISVQFSKPLSAPVTLTYLWTAGTAIEGQTNTGGADWKRPVNTVKYTVPAGTMSLRTVELGIWGDTRLEDNETLTLTVVLSDGAPVIQQKPTGTLTILNDD